MHYPGDLDLDDPVNLPRSERPPDLPPPMAMLPSNRGMSNYHHDPRKSIGSFSVLLSREFSRLPQTESLLAGWFYWSGKTFVLPVILTRYVNKRLGKKSLHTITFRENKQLFFTLCPYLLGYTFNFISCSLFLASDFDRSEELKTIWQVNVTGNSPKNISSPATLLCLTLN